MRRWRRPDYRIALLAAGAMLLATVPLADQTLQPGSEADAQAPLTPPRFEARLGRGLLELAATTASAEHEEALIAIVAALDGRKTDVLFRPGVALPARWQVATERALGVLATLESGSTTVATNVIAVRGVTADPEAYDAALHELRTVVSPMTRVRADVAVVPAAESISALCRDTFSTFTEPRIAFQQSSAILRTAARAVLDDVVEFAYDCRNTTIVVTGHTDASGDDAHNRKLSLMRAAAVAAYLARAGTSPDRLVVYGAGSTQPVADNETAYGRRLNRRIEFSLR